MDVARITEGVYSTWDEVPLNRELWLVRNAIRFMVKDSSNGIELDIETLKLRDFVYKFLRGVCDYFGVLGNRLGEFQDKKIVPDFNECNRNKASLLAARLCFPYSGTGPVKVYKYLDHWIKVNSLIISIMDPLVKKNFEINFLPEYDIDFLDYHFSVLFFEVETPKWIASVYANNRETRKRKRQ